MERLNGEAEPLHFLDPNKMLAHVVETCPELAAAFGRAANEHLPTAGRPWGLMLCFDEFVPGDKLKSYAGRKVLY